MKYLKTFEDLKTENQIIRQSSEEPSHTEDCLYPKCTEKRKEEEKIKSSSQS